jgi:hypothetical protein
MRYGSIEFQYAEPFANALVANQAFCAWVLQRTKFAAFANDVRVLNEEMQAKRSKEATNWWRSVFTEACRCSGGSGQETVILAIFETPSLYRFGVHFEVKQPTDNFPTHKNQAANYATRAACWVQSPPKAVLQHSDASSALLCSESKLIKYAPHISEFDAVITFEEISKVFPEATFSS